MVQLNENDTQWLFLAMSKSGHHAVMRWIFNKSKNRIRFFNNHQFIINKKVKSKIEPEIYNNEENNVTEARNLEDICPYLLYHNGFDLTKFSKIFIIIRDPFNWLASSYKSYGLNHLLTTYNNEHGYVRLSLTPIEIYKNQLKEVCGITKYLNHVYVVSYPEWVISEDYQNQIIQDLNLNYNPSNKHKVFKIGASSFDKRLYDGESDKMDVLGRWKYFKNDPNFLQLFDSELRFYTKKIFGEYYLFL